MTKAEVQWLQRNDLTRLDYDARCAAEYSNLIGLGLSSKYTYGCDRIQHKKKRIILCASAQRRRLHPSSANGKSYNL